MNQIISTPKSSSGRSVKIILFGVLGSLMLMFCLAAFGAVPDLLGTVRIDFNPIHLLTGALIIGIRAAVAAFKSQD